MSVQVAASSCTKEAIKSWLFKFAYFKNLGPKRDSNDFALLRKGSVSSTKSVILGSEICKNNLELRKISFTAEEIAQFVAESYRVRAH